MFSSCIVSTYTYVDGNAMSKALEAAYMYYDLDIAGSGSGMQHNVTLNITTKTRDRGKDYVTFLMDTSKHFYAAIVVFLTG